MFAANLQRFRKNCSESAAIRESAANLRLMQDAIVALAVFLLAGLFEISGGWLVWQTVREQRPWWWALLGSLVLVAYGFVPCLQVILWW